MKPKWLYNLWPTYSIPKKAQIIFEYYSQENHMVLSESVNINSFRNPERWITKSGWTYEWDTRLLMSKYYCEHNQKTIQDRLKKIRQQKIIPLKGGARITGKYIVKVEATVCDIDWEYATYEMYERVKRQ